MADEIFIQKTFLGIPQLIAYVAAGARHSSRLWISVSHLMLSSAFFQNILPTFKEERFLEISSCFDYPPTIQFENQVFIDKVFLVI